MSSKDKKSKKKRPRKSSDSDDEDDDDENNDLNDESSVADEKAAKNKTTKSSKDKPKNVSEDILKTASGNISTSASRDTMKTTSGDVSKTASRENKMDQSVRPNRLKESPNITNHTANGEASNPFKPTGPDPLARTEDTSEPSQPMELFELLDDADLSDPFKPKEYYEPIDGNIADQDFSEFTDGNPDIESKGEIIQIHIGQAGVQIANACWELYCLEHGIMPNGSLSRMPHDDSFLTFFGLTGVGMRVVPRLVMVDTEPTVIDEVRTGAYRNLFHPDTLISGNEDSGSNYARAYNLLGNELVDRTMNAIHRVAEQCSNLRAFIVFRAIGGGTGSGLGTLILEKLSSAYPKKLTKVEFLVFPSPSLSPIIVEPYNSILSAHLSMDYADVSFIVDNEALYEICASKLMVPSPTYTNLNRIIGQVVSAFTASQRFAGSANVSLQEFQTNLVPYPRIHYPLLTYSPLVPISRYPYVNMSVESLTSECFNAGSQMVRCIPTNGQYMSCVLLYRGDVTPNDINRAIDNIKRARNIKFTDWSPTGFKVGINAMPPSFVPGGDLAPSVRAVLAISNNTIIRTAWCRLVTKFNHLYQRRAFVYHYVGEGMEEGTLTEASMNICQLCSDYQEVEGISTSTEPQERGSEGSDFDVR